MSLPVSSQEGLDNLLELLGDKGLQKLLARQLAHIGGKDVRETARRMLRHVLAPDVMATFNFTGTGSKRSFKQCLLYKVVICAFRLGRSNVTDKRLMMLLPTV
uniref:DUF4806 domain-containing protein n=1 Tax=Macrostomum lignano TaxID=282301 RepID=A0A1I8G5R3_9PLAT